MLPVARKLRTSADFTDVVRSGRRAGAKRLVIHLRAPADRLIPPGQPARAGFVVSKAVGNSVTRHRLTRQLRPLMLRRLTALPPGTDVVVRVLPAAAGSSSADLAADLDRALQAATRSGTPRHTGRRPTRRPAGIAGCGADTAEPQANLEAQR